MVIRPIQLPPRFESREPELRREWESNPGILHRRWDEVRHGFRTGWEAGLAHGERDWDEIEPQLAACWSDHSVGGWHDHRDIVRLGYFRGQRERTLFAA